MTLPELKVRLRLAEDPAPYPGHVQDPVTLAALCAPIFDGEPRELLAVICFDQKNRPLGWRLVSAGSLTETTACPAEVFKAALLSNAAAIALAHNHPSGMVEPSSMDRAFTTRIAEGAKLLGFNLLDHVILGTGGKYMSFRERGWID